MENSTIMVFATVLMALAAMCSAISALCSMFFSRKQVEHNKKSVRPICVVKIEDYENKLAVSLVNTGIGPLVVKELSCKHKKTGVRAPDLIELMPKIDQEWATYYKSIADDAILVGDKAVLIELKPRNEEVKHTIRKALMDISVNVKYADIYGTIFEKQKDLDFFGRHVDSKKDGVT